MAPDLLDAPAVEQAQAIARGDVSSAELVAAFLERIDERNAAINAFVTVDGDRALVEAAEADSSTSALSPLHGIPIGIKDLTATKGMRTTFGSKAYADHVPDYDAATVRRMREAGMIIVGKTNTPEFGSLTLTDSELFGQCRNPWDTARNSGGSSGGGAASLAAGMIPISHGTDAGGSIRLPSAWCGLWGLKPSRGRVSLSPRAGERLAGLASEGPIARTVGDLAALLDVLAGYEWGDPYFLQAPDRRFAELAEQQPGRLRITMTTESPIGSPVDPACVAAVERTADLLSDLGHDVERRPFEWHNEALSEHIPAVWASLNAYYGDPDLSLVTYRNRVRAERGKQTTAVEYVTSRLGLERAARDVVGQWRSFDLLLTPTSPMLAAPNDFLSGLGIDDENARILQTVAFTRWFNATGQPAISVPVGLSEADLPLGVQLVGPPAGEALLLQVARQLELLDAVPYPAPCAYTAERS